MLKHLHPVLRKGLFGLVTVLSGLACLVAPWIRGPGLELAGLTPDWPLIWVVSWSVRRTALQGGLGGAAMGLVQDGLTGSQPTHALGLALVGILTARLQKARYVREDFISVALIVFGMVVLMETVLALQLSLLSASLDDLGGWSEGVRSLASIWVNHQRNTLISAVLSSLWAPALYLPLNHWWQRQFEDAPKDPVG